MTRSPAKRASRQGVDAVDRALKIVVALEAAERPLTLAALARETGLYKSTLLRLLTSLEAGALVRRTDQHYVLGPFAAHLGRAFERTHRLRACVLPVLHWLIAQGSESPSFHVLYDPQQRLCVFRIDSDHSTLDRVREGDLLPLSRGAPGSVLRCFAAGLPAAAGQPLMIASYGEQDPACGAAAAPVFGANGELVGALSLSGPLERFSRAAVRKMTPMLLEAAERATRALGGEWPALAKATAPAGAKAGVRR